MIDKYDEELQNNHKDELQRHGKLQKLQQRVLRMEQEHKDEQNYLGLQENQLREYERQYQILENQFHI